MLEIAGSIAAVCIGLTLGLIGAGGSILTVPVLVYLMGVSPVPATAYSLFVVGLTALAGSMTYMKRGLISYQTAVGFAVPAFLGVFAARRFILPAIPREIGQVGGVLVTKDLAIMVLFAILMLMASVSMIRKGKMYAEGETTKFNYPLILVQGLVVGAVTGLVGAGGGFLIIPVLVVLAKLPMKVAVGTSLLIIAVKSLLGFTGDVGTMSIDWLFLFKFSIFTVAGIGLGSYVSRFISGVKLRPAFGWFTLAMGVYVIARELLGHSS
jgi:uncharacterized membrane protein YfcA